MSTSRWLVFAAALLVFASACTAAEGQLDVVATQAPGDSASGLGYDGLPVDPAITPVSASNPSPDAEAAQNLCWTFDSSRGLQLIAGMGQIERARDATKYTRLTGREPEIQTDEPAWIIVYRGAMPQPRPVGEIWFDTTCVVIGDAPTIYATGLIQRADGTTEGPPPLGAPTLALPPLAP